ncbi:uncharacterized protein LOC108864993 [Galendromus occidentalis]|uniref:Uncharacterized protein LOC108864993 n=1 Tax=Galendromus occidentalis TaxID=34638 RepID=A0AAJ7L8I3_9ACAR|nr:uncharacterized protein LOC108864993 [Galendromus occidentalis]
MKVRRQLAAYDAYHGSTTYDLVDIGALNDVFQKVAVCKECHNFLTISVVKRQGVAIKVNIICSFCRNKATYENAERIRLEGESRRAWNLNVRITHAFRSIGKVASAMKIFCGLMDMPNACRHYEKFWGILSKMAERVCTESMKRAAEEIVILNDGSTDIAVALDGSWQKRGFTSLNGLVTATSFDTGKVLDVSVLSKYCRCPGKKSNVHGEKCFANFQGVSGAMEVEGAKEIFRRSVEIHGIRYVKYLGDGDSKAYRAVSPDEPYGSELKIEKLECVGLIQKRMGTRLRKLKAAFRGKKLEDGKPMSGKNRLTDAVIDEIHCFYGNAIRKNTSDLEKIRRAVWAIFKHLQSSNESPDHTSCDISWCKFLQNADGYDHNEHQHFPQCLIEEFRTIFEDLSDSSLLRKCLHGKTQNPNESVNHLIWAKIPKTVFESLPKLKTGVHIAISEFNDGHVALCRILEAGGITPGPLCVGPMKDLDLKRIARAERSASGDAKKDRITTRRRKRKHEETLAEADLDDPAYAAGAHRRHRFSLVNLEGKEFMNSAITLSLDGTLRNSVNGKTIFPSVISKDQLYAVDMSLIFPDLSSRGFMELKLESESFMLMLVLEL